MDVYRKVLVCAHEASGLEMGRLLTGRCELAVTARTVVVDVLLGMGMTEAAVVEASGWSQQRVNHLKNAARWRLKSLVGKMLREDVGRMVDNLYLCGSE